jgi:hypothetical protein
MTGVRVGSSSGMGGGEMFIITEFMVRNDKFDTVALIRVQKNFVFSDTVMYDYLVEDDAPDPDPKDGQCEMVGYGGPGDVVRYTVEDMVLRHIDVNYLPKSECENRNLKDFRAKDMLCTDAGVISAAYNVRQILENVVKCCHFEGFLLSARHGCSVIV